MATERACDPGPYTGNVAACQCAKAFARAKSGRTTPPTRSRHALARRHHTSASFRSASLAGIVQSNRRTWPHGDLACRQDLAHHSSHDRGPAASSKQAQLSRSGPPQPKMAVPGGACRLAWPPPGDNIPLIEPELAAGTASTASRILACETPALIVSRILRAVEVDLSNLYWLPVPVHSVDGEE